MALRFLDDYPIHGISGSAITLHANREHRNIPFINLMYFYFTLSDEKSKYAEKTAPRGAATKNLDKPDFIVVNEVFFHFSFDLRARISPRYFIYEFSPGVGNTVELVFYF